MNDVAPGAAPSAPDPGPGSAAAPVRPAATLILVRDAEPASAGSGLEVLMLRRHPESVFAAGAWVFPGGALDGADAHLAGAGGRTDAGASATLGLARGGLGFWVAAARECFEEAGILFARHADTGEPLRIASEWDAARFARHRRDLHAGRRSFGEILVAEGLVLDLDDIHYVSHWITPPGGSRRFDTRFFVAGAPAGQVASHDARETVESIWIAPSTALEGAAGGRIHLVFPTIKNLEALVRFHSVAELSAAARAVGPVPVAAPRFEGDPRVPPAALDGPSSPHPEPSCPT